MTDRNTLHSEQLEDFNNFVIDSKLEFKRYKNSGFAYTPIAISIKPLQNNEPSNVLLLKEALSVINFGFKNYKEIFPIINSSVFTTNQSIPSCFVSILGDHNIIDMYKYYDETTHVAIFLGDLNGFKIKKPDTKSNALMQTNGIYRMTGYITAREEENDLIHLRINYTQIQYRRINTGNDGPKGNTVMYEDYTKMTSELSNLWNKSK